MFVFMVYFVNDFIDVLVVFYLVLMFDLYLKGEYNVRILLINDVGDICVVVFFDGEGV